MQVRLSWGGRRYPAVPPGKSDIAAVRRDSLACSLVAESSGGGNADLKSNIPVDPWDGCVNHPGMSPRMGVDKWWQLLMKPLGRAETEVELADLIAKVNVDVPLRSEGRTKEHTERYCAARLLATLPRRRLKFPLQLDHYDRPDFVLSMADTHTGIEHTEVIPENVAHSEFLREKGHGPGMYSIPHAVLGESKKTGAELITEIEADEMGGGWYGDTFERDWAAAMLHFIQAKSVKAVADGFTRYRNNWLLLYDSWPGPNLNFKKAVSYLEALLVTDNTHDVFDSIFIIRAQDMCELNGQVTFFRIPHVGN